MNKTLHVILLILLVVSGLGPTVTSLAGVLPATWLKVASAVVAVASGLVLYVSQSPLFAPLLPVKAPEAVIAQEKVRAVKLAGPVITMLLVGLMLSGCSLFKSSTGTTVINDVGSVAACILQHIEQDVSPTVESVALECAPAIASDVVQILTALDAPSDAGDPTTTKAKAHVTLVKYLGSK